jgi:Transposase DDE domain
MEHQLWKEIVTLLKTLGKRPRAIRETYSDEEIVKTWLWAVLHDRPMGWACQPANWPPHERRWRKPSASRLSRRLRSKSVGELLHRLEQQTLASGQRPLVWAVDGKPLVISGCSKDRQAGYGRAAGGKAKGYKIHMVLSIDGEVALWRVAPMNKDERLMAHRLLRSASVQGYLLADSNYDSNKLHELCEQRGNLQLVSPRRYGPERGHGHRRQSLGRLRSKALLENPQAEFGHQLYDQRDAIERFYGCLSSWGGGLTHLPPWARTHRRVHRWIQGKLIFNAIRRRLRKTTYVA